jgi:hypothetical protein
MPLGSAMFSWLDSSPKKVSIIKSAAMLDTNNCQRYLLRDVLGSLEEKWPGSIKILKTLT